MNDTSSPVLSVVIIGRNEGERLVHCLESVNAMTDPGGLIEVIYVDSASTDLSPERAESLGAKVIRVQPERPSAAIGRNAGWLAASAPLILFLDGDTRLDPQFVVEAIKEFDDPEVAVVWGHRREMFPDHSIYNRVLDLDWIYPPGRSDFCGGDAIMRRSTLQSTGGFDPSLIAGEEPELCQRIRARGQFILHIDRAMTFHDLAITQWSSYYRRAFRAGHAYAEISQRLRNTAFPLWLRDSKRNMVHAMVLLSLIAGGFGLSVLIWSPVPLSFVILVLMTLVFRTAIKVSWKCRDLSTRILYGFHSHLQQIPIFIGQVSYWVDRQRKRQRMLIEYK